MWFLEVRFEMIRINDPTNPSDYAKGGDEKKDVVKKCEIFSILKYSLRQIGAEIV